MPFTTEFQAPSVARAVVLPAGVSPAQVVAEEPKDDDGFSTSAPASCNLPDLRTAQGGIAAGICLQKPGGSSGDWRQPPRGERKRKHTRLRPARTVSHEASRERLIELPRGSDVAGIAPDAPVLGAVVW